MATDLESGVQEGKTAQPRPNLKIVGLHLRGLKSIASLDLPADGLGWNGSMPSFLMLGGVNGSGKTTLLEFLASAVELIGRRQSLPTTFEGLPPALQAREARVDLEFSAPEFMSRNISILIGDAKYISGNAGQAWYGIQYLSFLGGSIARDHLHDEDESTKGVSQRFGLPTEVLNYLGSPSVVYFPSEQRTLISPPTNVKFAGKLANSFRFVDRWEPPKEWGASLEARLYGVRWEDLNAKEEGRSHESNGFETYSLAFDRFFEGRKQLRWHRGELVVETKNGVIHDLSALSSGEKQVILFMGELLDRWRPGSLILIDEPELHLHESYQTRLWESLTDWQKERGGQVIVATQSGHLFGLSEPGTRVILDGWRGK